MLLTFSMMMAAAAVGWLTWSALRPLLDGNRLVLAGLPWWWRAAWPWVSAVAPLVGPLCSWRLRARLTRAVELAGLPAEVGYAHVAALGVSAALLAGAVCGGLMMAFDAFFPNGWLWSIAVGLAAGVVPRLWLHGQSEARRRGIERDLPFVFDMMTLCVEAGLSVQGALQIAAQSGPEGALRDALSDALSEMRAGVTRTAAIKALAERCNSQIAKTWAAALAQAETLGISLGPVLRAQAAQCRGDRHVRAEQQAMQAPVKMLLPLIGCIFPCTFIVLAFPIAVQLLQSIP
ncbi:type II secretion system F family protein [Achromobacter sp. ESBL13]|uniref:type II secretion system F family protein n=1 Tax=Achromobacter sp. ESBL13 TaxID=3077328 RepID=UPI002FC97E24